MLNPPYCRGDVGRRHPRETMRIENQGLGSMLYWRCPDCHRRVELFEQEPLESRLARRDEVALIVNGETADRMRDWTPAVQLRIGEQRGRVVELVEARRP